MFEEITFENFALSDGKLVSFFCNHISREIELRLDVRKSMGRKVVPCSVSIRFSDVVEYFVSEKFTSGYYSDIILVRESNGLIYASFDPFDNSGVPNEEDNFIIRASSCSITQEGTGED